MLKRISILIRQCSVLTQRSILFVCFLSFLFFSILCKYFVLSFPSPISLSNPRVPPVNPWTLPIFLALLQSVHQNKRNPLSCNLNKKFFKKCKTHRSCHHRHHHPHLAAACPLSSSSPGKHHDHLCLRHYPTSLHRSALPPCPVNAIDKCHHCNCHVNAIDKCHDCNCQFHHHDYCDQS